MNTEGFHVLVLSMQTSFGLSSNASYWFVHVLWLC